MYKFNVIYFNFQDKILPQPIKRVMDYLQLESHHWSLVYCLSLLPCLLLSIVVSSNIYYQTHISDDKLPKPSNCCFRSNIKKNNDN
jgi:hypothetical protein